LVETPSKKWPEPLVRAILFVKLKSGSAEKWAEKEKISSFFGEPNQMSMM